LSTGSILKIRKNNLLNALSLGLNSSIVTILTLFYFELKRGMPVRAIALFFGRDIGIASPNLK
jgi:hypothetical protein